jgi:predicted AAA+ superfamily ATPase
MKYHARIIDKTLTEWLDAMGGVLLTGPKYCGKTETARFHAKSEINLEADESAKIFMPSDPKQILVGAAPRLIDEWQTYPEIWNYARHEIDRRQEKGQFILAGSSTPHDNETQNLHSGAGRFARLRMWTMTWQELGWSDGSASIKKLLSGEKLDSKMTDLPLSEIARHIAIGGWPALIGQTERKALIANRAYIDNIINVDLPQIDGTWRDPVRVRKTVESYARNISTPAKITTIANDVSGANDDLSLDPDSVRAYLDALNRLMIVEDLPAWNAHIRSAAKLRTTPKRYFTDPSLAVAALSLSSELIMKEPKYLGFLFEAQAIHDLRVYAKHNDAEVYFYRDSDGDEVDAIVEQRSGRFAIFEIKLGIGSVDEATLSLNRFVSKLTPAKQKDLVSRNVIIGSGATLTRPDGVNVISLPSLGA